MAASQTEFKSPQETMEKTLRWASQGLDMYDEKAPSEKKWTYANKIFFQRLSALALNWYQSEGKYTPTALVEKDLIKNLFWTLRNLRQGSFGVMVTSDMIDALEALETFAFALFKKNKPTEANVKLFLPPPTFSKSLYVSEIPLEEIAGPHFFDFDNENQKEVATSIARHHNMLVWMYETFSSNFYQPIALLRLLEDIILFGKQLFSRVCRKEFTDLMDPEERQKFYRQLYQFFIVPNEISTEFGWLTQKSMLGKKMNTIGPWYLCKFSTLRYSTKKRFPALLYSGSFAYFYFFFSYVSHSLGRNKRSQTQRVDNSDATG